MALTYHIHPERSLVVVTRTDRVGSEEWEAFLDQLIQDPAFELGHVRAFIDYEFAWAQRKSDEI